MQECYSWAEREDSGWVKTEHRRVQVVLFQLQLITFRTLARKFCLWCAHGHWPAAIMLHKRHTYTKSVGTVHQRILWHWWTHTPMYTASCQGPAGQLKLTLQSHMWENSPGKRPRSDILQWGYHYLSLSLPPSPSHSFSLSVSGDVPS